MPPRAERNAHDEPCFEVLIVDTDERYLCPAGQDLLRAMELAGRTGIPVGCRGGGCGACRVCILAGEYRCAKMSRQHVTRADEAAGIVLACRTHPDSALRLGLPGKKTEVSRPAATLAQLAQASSPPADTGAFFGSPSPPKEE